MNPDDSYNPVVQPEQPAPFVAPLQTVVPPPQPTQQLPPQPTLVSSPLPLPKKRKNGILVVIFLLIVMIVAVVGILLSRRSSGSKPTPPAPAQNVTQDQPSRPTQNGDVIKLTDGVSLTERPTLTLPTLLSGWQKDTSLPVGTEGIVHTGSCKLNYVPPINRTTDGSSDDKGTDEAIAAKLKSLEKTGKITEITYGTATIPVQGSTKKLEFKTASFTLTTEYVTYKLTITARQVDSYVLGAIFYCQRPAYDPNLNTDAIDKTTVVLKIKD